MSRYRASNAPTDIDRQIQSSLDRASRSVGEALQLMGGLPSNHRKRKVAGDLGRVMEALRSVRYIGVQGGDLDALAEDERNQKHRDRLAQERDERKAKRLGVKEQSNVG